MSIKRIIIALAAIGLSIGWYTLAYSPNRQQIATIDGQIGVATTQLDDFKATAAQLPALIKAQADLAKQKQRQLGVLFGKSEVLRLIDEVRRSAAAQSMIVTDVEPPVSELLALRETADKPGEPLFLNITVRLKGDYVGFGRFVGQVETLPYFRGVNYCSIIGPADQSTTPTYSLAFKALLGEGRKG